MGRDRISNRATACAVGISGFVVVLAAVAYAAIVGDPSHGKLVFQQACTLCHGADARGNGPMAASLRAKPDDLTDCRITSENQLDIVEAIVLHSGRYGEKAPELKKGMLTDQQIADVASYVGTLCTD